MKEKRNIQMIEKTKATPAEDKLHFYNLKNASQLMDYMNNNIEYGWIDQFGEKHYNNLKGFRENYRISSIETILKTRLGTCIEQAKLIKLFFDHIGLENRLYCYRKYETEKNFDTEVKMHCFVLFYYEDNWYHFEHANYNKRGIHQYALLEDAINAEVNRHDETDIRELTEIPNIPDGITFQEFNQYVNNFESITAYQPHKKR